jgi:hypothetical protein
VVEKCSEPTAATQSAGPALNPAVIAQLRQELQQYRQELGQPDANKTIAAGRTTVAGLECEVFTGASTLVRRGAGRPELDDDPEFASRDIKAPPTAKDRERQHAEEEVVNRFDNAAKRLYTDPRQVTGTLYILQSNPQGVCGTCLQGVRDPNKAPGVLVALSKRYPDLYVRVDTEQYDPTQRAYVKYSLTLQNGRYVLEE